MVRAALLKLRARMSNIRRDTRKPAKNAKVRNEEEKLEVIEERLENVTNEVKDEIEEIEKIKGNVKTKKHEFGWIRGKITNLLLQDFVGASFGAVVFVFTQEVWDITASIGTWNILIIAILSLLSGFALIYLSRRRKFVSMEIYHTAILRGVEIYVISFLTSFMFIMLLGIFDSYVLILKGSILIGLPAVISAATADLLFY